MSLCNFRANANMCKLTELVIAALAVGSALAAESKPLERPELRFGDPHGAAITYRADRKDFIIEYAGHKTIYEPHTNVAVIVEATVKRQEPEHKYMYNYKVTVLPDSTQRLGWFAVAFEGHVEEIRAPEEWKSMAIRWTPALTWSHYTKKPLRGLGPGEALTNVGFSATSDYGTNQFKNKHTKGSVTMHHSGTLPGLVRCYARGEAAPVTAETEAAIPADLVFPGLLDDAVRGWTIGPVALPEQTKAAMFVEQMISRLTGYLENAKAAGWLETEEQTRRHRERLTIALNGIRQGSREKTLGALTAVLVNIETEKKEGNLTDEAYALLKFNTEYLNDFVRTEPIE